MAAGIVARMAVVHGGVDAVFRAVQAMKTSVCSSQSRQPQTKRGDDD